MKKIAKLLLPLVTLFGVIGCSSSISKFESDTLYVNKVSGLSDSFIMGMDASSVIAEEDSGVKYYDYDGNEADVFSVLKQSGINYIRVRVWNDPYDENGKGYGGGNCDIAKAVEIGKRATKYGMKLLVDFHYSDFWADPSRQLCPKAWVGMDYFELAQVLYEYTLDSLQQLKTAGVDVGMVQVGNETNGGKMAGVSRFDYYVGLLNQAGKAIKKVYPKALIAVHFANPEKSANILDWAAKLKQFEANYDVFGVSYYSYWHGTLDNLAEVLSTVSKTYNKKVMVMETAYAYTEENTDFWSNTGIDEKRYPITIAGQANCVRDVIDTVANRCGKGIGVCYWEGTWISVGTTSYEENVQKWENYGSGWASSYAGDYDADAKLWYGGCAVENQAFFNEHGRPLESLKVFNLVRFGNKTDIYIDGIEDAYVSHFTDETFTLPETVNVIYNNNAREPIPVTWEDFDIAAAKEAGNAKYTIQGIAGGKTVYCYLTMMEYNFIENYSFEDTSLTPWVMTNNGAPTSDTYKVLITEENPQTGKYVFHFWSQEADAVNFDVEQKITLNTAGEYKYQISTMGGCDTGAADESLLNMYAYVKVSGTIIAQKPTKITSYGNWFDCLITGIEIGADDLDDVVVGFHIESPEAKIWGGIDDCMFNFVK